MLQAQNRARQSYVSRAALLEQLVFILPAVIWVTALYGISYVAIKKVCRRKDYLDEKLSHKWARGLSSTSLRALRHAWDIGWLPCVVHAILFLLSVPFGEDRILWAHVEIGPFQRHGNNLFEYSPILALVAFLAVGPALMHACSPKRGTFSAELHEKDIVLRIMKTVRQGLSRARLFGMRSVLNLGYSVPGLPSIHRIVLLSVWLISLSDVVVGIWLAFFVSAIAVGSFNYPQNFLKQQLRHQVGALFGVEVLLCLVGTYFASTDAVDDLASTFVLVLFLVALLLSLLYSLGFLCANCLEWQTKKALGRLLDIADLREKPLLVGAPPLDLNATFDARTLLRALSVGAHTSKVDADDRLCRVAPCTAAPAATRAYGCPSAFAALPPFPPGLGWVGECDRCVVFCFAALGGVQGCTCSAWLRRQFGAHLGAHGGQAFDFEDLGRAERRTEALHQLVPLVHRCVPIDCRMALLRR